MNSIKNFIKNGENISSPISIKLSIRENMNSHLYVAARDLKRGFQIYGLSLTLFQL